MQEVQKNIPASARVPALSTHKIANVSPGHRVTATLTHGVLGRPTTIGPPGVEVAIVGAGGARSALALLEQSRVVVTFMEKVEWGRHDPTDGRQGKKKVFE